MTTFSTLARLPSEVRTAGVVVLVVDEAHYVKNPDAARSRAVATATGEAQRTLFMAGTPMEDRVEEFRSLVRYLRPGIAARVDATDALAGAKAFRRAVAPVYLRLNQEDVLTELPGKIEVEDWVRFSSEDDATYASAVQSHNLMEMRASAVEAEHREPAVARAHRMGQIRTVQVHRLLATGSVDERRREIQENKTLLFDEFARKSDAKDADRRAVDTAEHRPAVLDDESVPVERRIILAEEHRLRHSTDDREDQGHDR